MQRDWVHVSLKFSRTRKEAWDGRLGNLVEFNSSVTPFGF
jgi:hypothetical protein